MLPENETKWLLLQKTVSKFILYIDNSWVFNITWAITTANLILLLYLLSLQIQYIQYIFKMYSATWLSSSFHSECFYILSYHFHNWHHFKLQRIIHVTQLQSDANDESTSLNMNYSCLKLCILLDWIVFVKTNWQDLHLHTWSTNHSAIPIGGLQEQQRSF